MEIGPKSKFRFLQFLKNDPELISSQFSASQHHFCKSLSDFHFFMKFTQNHQFWLKTLKKWAKNIFFIFFLIFSLTITKIACLNQIRAYNDIFSLKYSLSYTGWPAIFHVQIPVYSSIYWQIFQYIFFHFPVYSSILVDFLWLSGKISQNNSSIFLSKIKLNKDMLTKIVFFYKS